LPDVVQVAADGSHQQDAGAFDGAVLRAQEGFEHRHARLHGSGCDQYFRHVENVVLEVLADHAHPSDQSVGEHFLNRTPFGQGILVHLLDLFGVALVEVLIHQRIVRHVGSYTRLELNSSSASSIARMFSRGMPGLTPPPTDRMMPSPPDPSSTSSVASRTSSGSARTPTSSGLTFPIRHMRSPTRRFTSRLSVCLPQLRTRHLPSGSWSRL